MATSSFLHRVVIKDKSAGRTFVCALEESTNRTPEKMVLSKQHKDLKGDAIKAVLEDIRSTKGR